MRYVLAGLLAIGLAGPAAAVEIIREAGADGIDFTVTGVLNEGDDAVFRKVAAASEKAIVVLNSEGGSVTAGIEIGRAIKLRGFATAVGGRSGPAEPTRA
ncbi:hypothetical protein IB277_14695 [Ensifer sp. ENS07]|uniref:hypothetical protein n=1 Tax=unclassified Ensifer TaxID=2633371 RepID=UPI00177DE8A2|nr:MULTISPECIES: hypothetical protein [unclassified Ensifer]MBD9507951.1 hypothetical protein [Ensifer sp. ENS10]MBD9637552.1 hypothetical protein [Ensifer sp. ENS07]